MPVGVAVDLAILREIRPLVETAQRSDVPLDSLLRAVERMYLLDLLRDARGNQCLAAQYLKVHRNTLARRLRDLDIPPMTGRKSYDAGAR